MRNKQKDSAEPVAETRVTVVGRSAVVKMICDYQTINGLCEQAVASYLDLPDLVRFGLVERRLRDMCRDLACEMVKSEAECVHLRGVLKKTGKMPEWVRLRAVRRPTCVIRGYRQHWPCDTRPLPFALDSKGPVFVQFSIKAQKARNGTPTIGLVDAESVQKDDKQCSDLRCDMSRSIYGQAACALSLSPGFGAMFAAVDSDRSDVQLIDADKVAPGDPTKGRYKAELNWWSSGNEFCRENDPIDCGFFLADGTLTFYRRETHGHWHSTGVICEGLPERVVPCMFLFSFMGYAQVWFTGLRPFPPRLCPHCDMVNQGTRNGWTRMP